MLINEYINRDSNLYEDVEELISIDREENHLINLLIINIVLKYLGAYLGVNIQTVEDIKGKINSILDTRVGKRGLDNIAMVFGGENAERGNSFPVDCLSDIRQTSGIFKEIALDSEFEKKDKFNALDLGSGTGILSLATYITGKRNKISKGEIYGIDMIPEVVKNADNILSKLNGDYSFINRIGNLTDINTYNKLPMDDLSYIVSETVSSTTPQFTVDADDGEIMILGNEVHESIMSITKSSDPFPTVIGKIVESNPELYQDIKYSKVGMFPNFPRKLYIPNGQKSTIVMRQSGIIKPVNIDQTGNEFKDFESLSSNCERWENNEANNKKFEQFIIEMGLDPSIIKSYQGK